MLHEWWRILFGENGEALKTKMAQRPFERMIENVLLNWSMFHWPIETSQTKSQSNRWPRLWSHVELHQHRLGCSHLWLSVVSFDALNSPVHFDSFMRLHDARLLFALRQGEMLIQFCWICNRGQREVCFDVGAFFFYFFIFFYTYIRSARLWFVVVELPHQINFNSAPIFCRLISYVFSLFDFFGRCFFAAVLGRLSALGCGRRSVLQRLIRRPR